MNSRIRVVSQTNDGRSERECEILYKDHKILIARPVSDKFNELLVFYAYANSQGFIVVLPGESLGVNLCEIGTPKASGRYKMAANGSVTIEIDPTVYAMTYRALSTPSERKRWDRRRVKKSKKN